MKNLVNHLKEKKVLRSKKIEEALFAVDRKDFITPQWQEYAYKDTALPTLEKQTISQPYTVVFMLEKLSPSPGQVILDIGAGSGWQTALLATVVGEKGKVYAYEINPTLLNFAKENLKKYPSLYKRVQWMGDGRDAPDCRFNSLIVAADISKEIPLFWRRDLLPGGRLVYPSNHFIVVEKKDYEGNIIKEGFPGFVFVPFI